MADTVESVISGGGKIVSGMIRSGAEIAQQFITRSADILDKIADSSIGKILPGISTQPAKPTINYVAFGDSTSMGYLMNDFCDGYVRMNYNNTKSSKFSTYSQFSDYLTQQGNIVSGIDLSMLGMRPSELRAILDGDYYEDQMSRPHNFCEDHMSGYIGVYGTYENIHSAFTKAISEADIITYDILMAEFGVYLVERIEGFLSGSPYLDYDGAGENFAQLMRENNCPEIAASAEALSSKIQSLLAGAGLPADMVSKVLDMVLYTYAHFAINFSVTMDQIYTLNPDVELIVVGPVNPISHMTATYNGIDIDVSALLDCMISSIAAYTIKGDSHASQYLYADCTATGLESFIDDFAKGTLFDPTADFYGAYSAYRKIFFRGLSLPENFDTLVSPEVMAAINENIKATCSCPRFDLTNLLSVLSASEADSAAAISRALFAGLDLSEMGIGDFSDLAVGNAAPADRFILLFFFISQARGSGYHPSAKGCLDKAAAIALAHQRGYTADGTYLARAIETSEYLTANAIGAIWNIGDSRNNLKTFFTDLFTPVIDLSELIGGLLKK